MHVTAKNAHFVAALLLLGSLAAPIFANPVEKLTPLQRDNLQSFLVQGLVGRQSLLARYKRPIAYLTLATIAGYVGSWVYAKSKQQFSPYLRTLSRLNAIADTALGDIADYLQGDADELPQSTQQAVKMLMNPEVQQLIRSTLQSGDAHADQPDQLQTIDKLLAFLATDRGQQLGERITSIATSAYFTYSHKLIEDGLTGPGALQQIVDAALSTPERLAMVERSIKHVLPSMIVQLQITMTLLREKRQREAAARGEEYVEVNEYTFEKLTQALSQHPVLLTRMVERAVESSIRTNRPPTQGTQANTVTGRPPAASSLFWVMIRYPNAIIRGAFWGAMQQIGQRAQQDETPLAAQGAPHAS